MQRLILSILAVFAIATIATVSIGCKSGNTSSSGNMELQGTWTGEWTLFTFSGNNFNMTPTDETVQGYVSGTFTLNPTANPKTIDIYITASPSTPQFAGTTSLGLYMLSGTSLTLALGEPGDARPTAFTEDITITLVKGSNANTGSNTNIAYSTTLNEIKNAVTGYAVDHQGKLPTLAGTLTVAECTNCPIVDMNALLGSNGGMLRAVPAGCYQNNTPGINDNCDSGASGCSVNNHYVWIVATNGTENGNVYSKCTGNDCASNNQSGYQGVWP